ncbi:hypothetical protein [Prolixibacter denitrificans]|uniref:PKD domain-containing protein n=1 Tax=Prolixibacter denitrificans TaxID=1541063 RepID=A0A2P8CL48_9BACT|nr:hypothetical protein [Prolixibacter denitrificans]PSK85699.1 hypothetical protein CLV93_101668 [Prolixibacter denitrificans]GET20318.1 hypothetical protein JCM18694_05640 [Prolixibacter denitrificans]
MKKLIILSLIAFFALGSAKVFAQSTGKNPYPGATHTYSVTEHLETDGATPYTYTWEVLDAAGNDASTVAEIDKTSGTNDGTTNSISITWKSNVTTGVYYLVKVTEKDASGCENTRALPVMPKASTFDLAVEPGGSNSGMFCYDGKVNVNFNSSTGDVTYDHGTATVTYKVSVSGIGTSETWGFNIGSITATGNSGFDATKVVADLTASGIVSVSDANGSGTVTYDKTNQSVSVAAGVTSVNVKIELDNNNGYGIDAPVDAQDFTETLNISNPHCSSGAVESTSNDNNHADVTVSRPDTSPITAY